MGLLKIIWGGCNPNNPPLNSPLVYTHRFSPEPYQYLKHAHGAMRLPCIEAHQPVFTLIEYLNMQFPEDPIELIDFNY